MGKSIHSDVAVVILAAGLGTRMKSEGAKVLHHIMGKPMITYVMKTAQELAVAGGVTPDKVTPHTLRHAFATHLLENGVNIRVVEELMGHADDKTTEIYTKVDAEQTRKALEGAYEVPSQDEIPAWEDNKSLMSWLSELCE